MLNVLSVTTNLSADVLLATPVILVYSVYQFHLQNVFKMRTVHPNMVVLRTHVSFSAPLSVPVRTQQSVLSLTHFQFDQ